MLETKFLRWKMGCGHNTQCCTWMHQTPACHRNPAERYVVALQRHVTGLAPWWNLSSNQAWTLVIKVIKIQLVIFPLSRRRLMTARNKVVVDKKLLSLERTKRCQWVCQGPWLQTKLFLQKQSEEAARILQWEGEHLGKSMASHSVWLMTFTDPVHNPQRLIRLWQEDTGLPVKDMLGPENCSTSRNDSKTAEEEESGSYLQRACHSFFSLCKCSYWLLNQEKLSLWSMDLVTKYLSFLGWV